MPAQRMPTRRASSTEPTPITASITTPMTLCHHGTSSYMPHPYHTGPDGSNV